MSDLRLSTERQKGALETLQEMGRAVAIELKDVGVPVDDHIASYGRVPRPGWLNKLLGRTELDFVRVDGWESDSAPAEDIVPILLAADGDIYIIGSGLSSSTEGYPLAERHVATINAARAVQNGLYLLEAKHNLHEKIRAKAE